jgi:hypothetical protein
MRIAYLTGEYPRATDTFIQREVATLREQGVEVHTFSVRRTGDEHMVGPEQKRERDRTFYILPPNPLNLWWAHLRLLLGSPSRYFHAIQLAWSTRQPGLQGGIYQWWNLFAPKRRNSQQWLAVSLKQQPPMCHRYEWKQCRVLIRDAINRVSTDKI